MKLIPDKAIKTAYRVTKAQITKKRNKGCGTGALRELEARLEFLERVFDF